VVEYKLEELRGHKAIPAILHKFDLILSV